MANPVVNTDRLGAQGSSRRTLLKCLASAPVAAAAAPIALAAETDPVVLLYRDWQQARDDWMREAEKPENGNFDSPASEDAYDREWAAYRAMIETPPTSVAGLAAMASVLVDYLTTTDNGCDELAVSILEGAEALA